MLYEIDKTKLRELFDRDFRPVLEEMEPYRKKKNRSNMTGMYLFIGGFLLMITFGIIMFTGASNMLSSNLFYAMFALPFVFFVARRFVSSPYRKDWISRYKDEIAKPLVKFVDCELNYRPDEGISREEYTRCGMFRKSLYSYSSEDLISGKHGNIDFKFSEVHGKYESKDSDGDRTIRTDFDGVLLVCDFNKHFKGEYVLSTDVRDTTWIGKFINTIRHDSNAIKLENPEFEKHFDLRGTDQVEGRYIFSHTMMEQILELKESFRIVRMSLKDNKLYVALNDHFDLLNHDFRLAATDYKNIEQTVDRICSIIGVIDILNLNLDIWKTEEEI